MGLVYAGVLPCVSRDFLLGLFVPPYSTFQIETAVTAVSRSFHPRVG